MTAASEERRADADADADADATGVTGATVTGNPPADLAPDPPTKLTCAEPDGHDTFGACHDASGTAF